MTSNQDFIQAYPDLDVKHEVAHAEEALDPTIKWAELKAEADRDEELQHRLTLFQSIKVYRHVSAEVSPDFISDVE